MDKEEFLKEVELLGIDLDKEKLEKLDKFYELLISWNEKINLTTITKKEDVYLKHFYDSLTLIKSIDLTKNLNVLDVGTGAGFPGIVLKIVFPNLKITLLDSLNKRINYLNEIIKELDLKDIETKWIRIEDYAKVEKEKYDLIVSRAVSHLGILIETTLPLLKINSYMIAMKGDASSELKESAKILTNIKAKIVDIKTFNLPVENSLRTLVKIQKLEKTPSKYPREYKKIKNEYKK